MRRPTLTVAKNRTFFLSPWGGEVKTEMEILDVSSLSTDDVHTAVKSALNIPPSTDIELEINGVPIGAGSTFEVHLRNDARTGPH